MALLGVSILSTATSCVGKKRFTHEVSVRDSMVSQLNNRVIELNQEIAMQKIQIAEKNGEIKALRDLQDKQDAHINRLKQEIEKLTNQSLSQQQLMDMTLKRKQEEIAAREQVLEGMRNTMNEQEQGLRNILGQLQAALSTYDSTKFTAAFRDGSAIFGIAEELLFRPGTTTPVKSTADILDKVARILNQHPEVNIMVKGHTDNQPIKGRTIADNWEFSAQRSAALVKILTKDYYLNPSQITVAGKGEFEPSTSNESVQGRERNRRIEFVLTPKIDRVFRMIREYSKPGTGE